MKKLLSLTLVLTMLFTIIAVPSVSAAVVTNEAADAEGFKTVYLFGYENGSTEPTGGGSNFFTNAATAVKEGDATVSNNLESVTTYAAAGIDKPVSPVGEDFGDKVHSFDFSNGGKQTVTTCIARIGKIKNQITFESGATYRASFWIRIDDTSIDGDYAALVDPFLCIGDSTSATNQTGGSIATAKMGTRIIKRGEWTKVGMTFTSNDTFVSAANTNGWGIRWNMHHDTYGTTVKGYIDNFRLEKLDARTRVVEPNYVYFEGFDNAVTGGAISDNPYYSSYFTPTYPKPTDNSTVEWTTRALVVPFGGGSPSFGVKSTYSYSGGSSILNSLTSADSSGGNYISDIFHGDFTSADIGRRFKISAKVYPVSSKAATAPSAGGTSAHFYIALGGSDGVGNANYGNAYRSFRVNAAEKDMEWDKWNEISTTFAVTDSYVVQTSVTNDEVATKNAYTAVNALRINQSNSKNLTTEFYTDDYLVRELKKYTISATSNDTTIGTVAGGGEVWEDEETTLTATANETSMFVGWYKNNELVTTETSLKISNPTEDATYVARFRADANKGDLSADGFKTIYTYGNESTDTAASLNSFGSIVTNGTGKNTNGLVEQSTYLAARTSAPSVSEGALEEEFGSGLINVNAWLIAKRDVEDTEEGALVGTIGTRINNLTRAMVPMTEGKWYRVSLWMKFYDSKYNESDTATGKFIWTTNGNGGSNTDTTNAQAKSDNFVLKKDVWQKVGIVFQASSADIIEKNGIKITFTDATTKSGKDYITGFYLDNFKIEEYQGTPDSVPANYKWDWSFDDVKAGQLTTAEANNFHAAGNPGGYTVNYGTTSTANNTYAAAMNWGQGRGDATVSSSGIARTGVSSLQQLAGSKPLKSQLNGGLRIHNLFHSPLTEDDIGRTFKISLWVYAPKSAAYLEKYYASSTEGTPSVENPIKEAGTGTRFTMSLGGVPPYDTTLSSNQTSATDYRNCVLYPVEKDVPYDTWTEFSIYWTVTANEIAGAKNSAGKYTVIDALRIGQYNAGGVGENFPFVSTYYVDDLSVEEVGTGVSVDVKTVGEELVGTATVFSSSSQSAIDITLILASYDETGRLVKMEPSETTSFSIASTFPVVTPEVKLPKTGYKYYAFVWDNLDKANPYMKPIDITDK